MVAATVSANPLKLDVRSHWKCIAICFIATLSTFQYGMYTPETYHRAVWLTIWLCCAGLDYALVGGFLSYVDRDYCVRRTWLME